MARATRPPPAYRHARRGGLPDQHGWRPDERRIRGVRTPTDLVHVGATSPILPPELRGAALLVGGSAGYLAAERRRDTDPTPTGRGEEDEAAMCVVVTFEWRDGWLRGCQTPAHPTADLTVWYKGWDDAKNHVALVVRAQRDRFAVLAVVTVDPIGRRELVVCDPLPLAGGRMSVTINLRQRLMDFCVRVRGRWHDGHEFVHVRRGNDAMLLEHPAPLPPDGWVGQLASSPMFVGHCPSPRVPAMTSRACSVALTRLEILSAFLNEEEEEDTLRRTL